MNDMILLFYSAHLKSFSFEPFYGTRGAQVNIIWMYKWSWFSDTVGKSTLIEQNYSTGIK